MESGERLPSSPAPSTTPTSSAPSVASAVSKSSLPTGAASLGSAASPCGAEWWRTTDGHSRAGTPFFPPLLGIPPLFAPPAQNHDSSFHSRTSGKSNRNGPEKGINGSVNGNSAASVHGVNTSGLSTPASSSMGQNQSTSSGGGNLKCHQEQNKSQPVDARADKIKDKKPRKKAMESSSNSDSDSGTSSDTSSEGISSSDSDDLEEEEEEDQSIEESEDDDSDSETEAQHKSNNQEQYKQTFPSQVKKQESGRSLKKVIAALSSTKATSSPPAHPKLPLDNNHPNPFLTNALLGNHQPNGVIQSVIQEAPLALTTKTKMQSKINENVSTSTPFSSPVNLSTGGRRTPGSQAPALPSASPILHSSGKEKRVSTDAAPLKGHHHPHPATSLVEQFRGTDSDIPSSKDSEDSNEDEEEDEEEEDEEDDEDDESDDSQSESDSNSESDSEGSEDDDEKDQEESDSDTEGAKPAVNLTQTSSSAKSPPSSLTAHSAPHNLHIGGPPGSAPAALCSESQPPAFLGTSSSTLTSSPHSGTYSLFLSM